MKYKGKLCDSCITELFVCLKLYSAIFDYKVELSKPKNVFRELQSMAKRKFLAILNMPGLNKYNLSKQCEERPSSE